MPPSLSLSAFRKGKKRSEPAPPEGSKRAKAQPKNPSPGPSGTPYQQIPPDPPVPMEDVPMEGDPTATNPRFPSPDLLSLIAQEMEFIDDGDPPNTIHTHLRRVYRQNPPVPEGFVTQDVFLRNLSHDKASDFLDLVKKALREKDWKDVVIHDVFWTELPTDSSPRLLHEPPAMMVPQELSERAAELTWTADFVNDAALRGLEDHVTRHMVETRNYARFCSIVQSSGMGKSRLLDEFSKGHFLIPINLRERGSQGFPPPDVAVRKFLTDFDSNDKEMQQKSYSRACHFLFSLFVRTKDTIATLASLGDDESDRILKFRAFMSEEQKFGDVGEKRKNFYAGVVSQAQKAIDDRAETPSQGELLGAFERLRECVYDGTSLIGNRQMADIFIAFDEAHPLTMPWDNSRRLSNYIELRRALQLFTTASLFTFFLSTNGQISLFIPPPTSDPSSRILQGKLHTPRPFIELGFDQLMWNRKILEKYKTLEQVTSSECIAHMGRPMWGTIYDLDNSQLRQTLLFFAIQKLLHSPIISAETKHQQYAVLSQRLALDINTTAYTSATRIGAEATLNQITNHMRVCVEIGEGTETIRGIAASEPILSEAASYVMRKGFDLATALSDVLSGFSINVGDRGELLVAAFFTWARDAVMVGKPSPFPEFCRHFSVEELFTCLFSKRIAQSIFNHTPSISPSGSKQQTFGEVAASANMHFNHFIQSQERDFITCRYLIALIARGAAVLGSNCQPGFDAVLPYLYGSTDLDDKNVGFIMVQVKNDSKISVPDAKLFRKMDPFERGLLDESDFDESNPQFSIPIIRIVFALRGKRSTVTPMRYSSPSEGASSSSFDKGGEPRFTSYDYWCSGIGPDLIQPVGEADEKWKALLDPPDQWSSFYGHSPAPDVLRSQFPASSRDKSHLNRWLSDRWISGHS